MVLVFIYEGVSVMLVTPLALKMVWPAVPDS